jgi:uncharacterized Zn finger protein
MGESWWAQRWLSTLESFGWEYQNWQSRGRRYARGGHVLQAEVYPGQVVAQVQGSQPRPYQVRIRMAPLSEDAWERVTTALADQATYVAQLLAGEMPRAIEAVFDAAGSSLFPQSPEELPSSCTCFDWANPCKHIAAVQYVLASKLDTDPSLILVLRGRTIQQLTAALRASWAAEVGGGENVAVAEPAQPASGDEPLQPLRAAGFFHAGPDLDAFSLTISAPLVEAALLKRLGRPPFATAHEDPLPPLTALYAAVTRRALQALGRSGEARRQRKT